MVMEGGDMVVEGGDGVDHLEGGEDGVEVVVVVVEGEDGEEVEVVEVVEVVAVTINPNLCVCVNEKRETKKNCSKVNRLALLFEEMNYISQTGNEW